MKIVCDCGAESELVDPTDGSSYTPNEGWYKVVGGDIRIVNSYYAIFFKCKKCGKEWWCFT